MDFRSQALASFVTEMLHILRYFISYCCHTNPKCSKYIATLANCFDILLWYVRIWCTETECILCRLYLSFSTVLSKLLSKCICPRCKFWYISKKINLSGITTYIHSSLYWMSICKDRCNFGNEKATKKKKIARNILIFISLCSYMTKKAIYLS